MVWHFKRPWLAHGKLSLRCCARALSCISKSSAAQLRHESAVNGVEASVMDTTTQGVEASHPYICSVPKGPLTRNYVARTTSSSCH